MTQGAVIILFDDSVAGVFAAAIDTEDTHCREFSRRALRAQLPSAVAG
jgi:hypothetical protein